MHPEINKIADHCFEYAKQLLTETGEFYPFGAFVGKQGRVHPLEFDIENNKIPNNGKVIEALAKYCNTELEASNINGFGLAYEVNLKLTEDADYTDAIAVEITHISEKNIPVFYLPYSVKKDLSIAFSTAFAVLK